MFSIFFLILVVTSVNSRIPDALGTLREISENAIGSDRSKSNLGVIFDSTQSNADQKVNTKHEDIDSKNEQINANNVSESDEINASKTEKVYLEFDNNVYDNLKTLLTSNLNLSNTNIVIHLKEKSINTNETALKLTPYINEGLLEKARNASEVNSTMFLGHKSYSGYLTVNEQYNSNTFFWYFPVEGKPVEETPWIIWLQGGPGVSSLLGLFHEIGPFTFDKDGILKENPYTWLHNHSLVFIDNPIGAGFSFTDHKDGYARNMETYSTTLYEATRQLLVMFPELEKAPLYVAGESYAGKYVPSLALELHRHKDQIKVNLQGIILGNALTEHPFSLSVEPWLFFGILDASEARELQPRIDDYYRDIAAGKHAAAAKKWRKIGKYALLHSYQDNLYNYLQDRDPTAHSKAIEFLKTERAMKALHVGSNRFVNFNTNVYDALDSDSSNVQPKIEALLEHYKVLAYCGNLDQMFPCSTAAENHRKWNWTGLTDFVKAPRQAFRFQDEVKGYFKTGGQFTEVVLIGAGHMVPADKPAVIQDLISKWTHGESLTTSVCQFLKMMFHKYRINLDNTHPLVNITLNTALKMTNMTQDQTTESPTTEAVVSNVIDKTLNSDNESQNSTKKRPNEIESRTTEAEISNDISYHNEERKPGSENNNNTMENVTNKMQALDSAYQNNTTQKANETQNQTETSTKVATTEAAIKNDIFDEEQPTPKGTPLILTPYLKEGLLEQARNASEVNSTVVLGYKSYSGFFTVNETYNSNTFFWYFPVEHKPVEDAPCIIWLQGGPGITSLFGLTSEIGPFFAARDGLKKNPNSWLQNHSLVFIDNPVGTGFSFTDHKDGFVKDMQTYSAHLFSATRQLLTLFPALQRAPLFVAGESYGGKYAPSLALELHRHKDEITVNLQGIMVGNGYIDPVMIRNFTRSFYNFGLLGPEDLTELRKNEAAFDQALLANQGVDAKDVWGILLSKILDKTQLDQGYNFLSSKTLGEDLETCMTVVQDQDIRGAIHVGGIRNNVHNATVGTQLKPEFPTSAKTKYEELMEHYRVLLYCGQLDQMLSCGVASEFHLTFNWSGHAAFVAARKKSFRFNNSPTITLIYVAPPITTIAPELILTPAIKEGRIQEAREASKVDPKHFLNVTSHSGFLTVDETYNSNLFFWYFPVASKNVSLTPWIIWLQGGPGASSLAGVFDEMGPFSFDKNKKMLELRESSWCINYNMLFIDNPIGAGYSFTDSDNGYATSMAMYSSHLYKALQQFLQVFPELRKAGLFIAGESYAGHYVPAFAQEILKRTPERTDKDTINLQGIMLGNPILERENIAASYIKLYELWGLVDSQGALAALPIQEMHAKAIRDEDFAAAIDTRNDLLDTLADITLQTQMYNILHDEYSLQDFLTYLDEEQVKESMHTGLREFTFSNRSVLAKMKPEFLAHMRPVMETLLENYRVLIYCGQLDLVAPCSPNAEARRKKWHWSKRNAFLSSPRNPWWYNESIAGYVKSGGGLTEVLVRGAGHLVPLDKPAQAQRLISFFIEGFDFPLPPNYVPQAPPEYVDHIPEDSSSSYKTAMIVSLVVNVLLLVGIVAGALLYRLKLRRDDAWLYSDSVPTTDSVLNLT